MKLAFCLFKYFPYGGLQRDFLRIALECLRRGHSVQVYTMEWQGETPKNLQVTIIPAQGVGNHRRCLAFAKQLPNYLQHKNYDLVVGFNKMPGLDVYFAADPCYIAKSQLKHSLFYRFTARYRTYTQLEKAVFSPKAQTQILLLTAEQQNQFSHFYQTPSQRLHLLPPGIDRDCTPPPNAAELRTTMRRVFQIADDEYCVLMVGSGFKTKGVDRALLALQALPPALLQKTHLLIIGQGNHKPFLQLAQKLNVHERVQFLGGRDDVKRFLLSADLLLHSSYAESAGIVLLEALVAGLPVLTTAACGYAPYIQRARAGVVLPLPFQQTELNQQLASMLNSSQRKVWQHNALTYAAKTDLYSLVEKTVNFLENHARSKKPTISIQPIIEVKIKEKISNNKDKITLLDPTLKTYFKNKNIFSEIFKISGEFFRQHKNRETLRISVGDRHYFLKRHNSIGWREIFKNLAQVRWPVISAQHEWRAIQRLTALNIPTTPLAAYGSQGTNPAHIQSFIITQEITDAISLEDFCRPWPSQAPSPALKRQLITAIAHIARTLHTNGINHRDFYLCHFLLDTQNLTTLKISLIDLHRTLCRIKTPQRAIIKDLAGLYFSSLDIGLNKKDLLRFIKNYSAQPLRTTLQEYKNFWHKIEKRALHLYTKIEQKTLAAITTPSNFSTLLLGIDNTRHLLHCEQLIRIVPDKRWVFFAQWNKQAVVAKLFKQSRHAIRELQGYQALIDTGICTPELIFHGWSRGGNCYVLLYERILPAEDYDTLLAQADSATQKNLLLDLLAVIAQQHQAGIKQRDMHFNNFLLSHNQIYTLDAADISKANHPLGTRASLKNLALLFAQLQPHNNHQLEDLYRSYLQVRGMAFTLGGWADLKKWLAYWHKQRLYVCQRKVFRSSTAIICRKSWWQFSACVREHDSENMRLFLSNPEAMLNGPVKKTLKNGNSSTVVLIEINGRKYVVKRYNIKSFWHGIKRALQATRAAISWRNGHGLVLAIIPTAKPVALLEKRFGPFRSTSYFISEHVPNITLQNYFSASNSLEENMFIGEKVMDLIKRLANMHISHGDLKATNILMVGSDPLIIDLDAMHLHRFIWRWRLAQAHDQQRFLKNWESMPEIKKMFEQLFAIN